MPDADDLREPGTVEVMSAPGVVAPARRRAHPHTVADLRVAGVIVLVLAALGALLGALWATWSGSQQRAFVLAPGKLYPYDEVETMAAADGRYLVIVAAVGLLATLVVWYARAGNRGSLVLLALCGGGLGGAALTWWVGYLTGGGSYHGKKGTTIPHLPLTLHMHGLLLVEPAVAALVYGLFTAFAAHDDLGRPDPVRDGLSVDAGGDAQHGGGDRDAAGALQQGNLPTQ
jgi:hypothetical protein